LNQDQIKEYVKRTSNEVKERGFFEEKWESYHLDPKKFSFEQVVAYVFVVDTLNFCFWPLEQEHLIQYEDMTKALAQILEQDPEFFTPLRLSQI